MFRPSAEGAELRSLAVRAAGATVFSSAAGLVVQILATVILARLLTPGDFGVVTMVTTFSLLLINFGGNGFTEAVVQRRYIDHNLVSNLFWINFAAGVGLTLVFAAAGTLLARFYGNPLVARVALGISLTILVTGTAVEHQALLKRAMRFTAISGNDLVSRIVYVVIAVACGWAGWGYWALVVAAIAQPLSQAIGAWILCRWVPGRPRLVPGTGEMVRFAINIYGRFTVNYFSRNTDNLLVGWQFHAQALGFYKKAYDLFALSASQLVSPLTAVAVSALSRLRENRVQYERYLIRSLGVMAFIGMGVGADLTLVGKDVIRLLLGPGWEPAGRIFTFFGPGIGIMMLYGTHGWIHLSIGRADRWFRWGILEFVVTGLLFVFGLHWGPVGMAVAWTASFWLLTVPAFWYAGQPIQLGVMPIITAVWRFLIASLLAGAGSFAIIQRVPLLMETSGSFVAATRVFLVSSVFVTQYLLVVVLLHGGTAPIQQVLRLLSEMAPWRRMAKLRSSVPAAQAATVGDAISL
jgi:O-antigen/teichoic acid export membrane protein